VGTDVQRLKDEWQSLSETERTEIWNDFEEACHNSGYELLKYWHPLPMPSNDGQLFR